MEVFSKKKDIIVIIGRRSYKNPFWGLGRVTRSLKPLIDYRDQIALAVFTGGEDVHPSLYNGVHRGMSETNVKRDRHETEIFEYCLKHNIKLLGICRGVQFLRVMAGGPMYQHIGGHVGVCHKIIYPALSREVVVNSFHHQLIKLTETGLPIAWSSNRLSRVYVGPNHICEEPPRREVEVAVFPKINAMGVQFHPELMPRLAPGRILFREMAKDFMNFSIEAFISKYAYREKMKDDRRVQTATAEQ